MQMPCLRTRLRTVVAHRRRRSRSPDIGEHEIVFGDGVDVREVRGNPGRELRVRPHAAEAAGGDEQLQLLVSGAQRHGRWPHGVDSFHGVVPVPYAVAPPQAPGEMQLALAERRQAAHRLRVQMVASVFPVAVPGARPVDKFAGPAPPQGPAPARRPAAGAVQHGQPREGIRRADAPQVVGRFAPSRLALRIAGRSTDGAAQGKRIGEHVAPNHAVLQWLRASPMAVLRSFRRRPEEGVARHVPIKVDPIQLRHAVRRRIVPQRRADAAQPGQIGRQLRLYRERRQRVRHAIAVLRMGVAPEEREHQQAHWPCARSHGRSNPLS